MADINGTLGDDVLIGTPENDIINGFAGNDTLVGLEGDDTLDGGGDTDTASYASADGSVEVDLGFGAAAGADGNDILIGIENIIGSAFSDFLVGDAGINMIFGGGGDDDLIGQGGDDHLDGGDGNDTAGYFDASGAVTVDLAAGTATGADGNDTLVSIEHAIGSQFGDMVTGDANANIILGFAGDDVIAGGGGDDVLRGDGLPGQVGLVGNDTLSGGDGDDYMNGGAGTDIYDGGDGFDRISFYALGATQGVVASLITQSVTNDGFGNAETMTSVEALGAGTAYADHLTGDENANLLLGESGDTLIANGGDDSFQLSGAPALLDGGDGVDTINAFVQQRLVPDSDGDGRAELEVSNSGVHVDLGLGMIVDDGFGGSGTIQSIENVGGSDFDDVLVGDDNANILTGHGGDDLILGFAGDDTLDGGDGNDVLRGDGGAGYNGPGGNDTLLGGAGDDYMNGGPGADDYDGGDGFDRISFYASAATQGAVASLLTQTIDNDGFGNAETMVNVEGLGGGTAYADHFTGDDNANALFGSVGDTIIAHGGDDRFQLEGAPALLDGGDGVDTITAIIGNTLGLLVPDTNGDGLAELVFSASGVHVDLSLGMIVDDGFGNSGTLVSIENVGGSDLDDLLIGDDNANTLTGRAGNDTLDGGLGDDTLDGGDGNDTLDGWRGSDVLIGGSGDDSLNGGPNTDRFEFGPASGHDTITDFDKRTEVIAILDVAGVDDFSDLSLTQVGRDTLVSWDGGAASVLILGVKPQQLDSGNFDFGTAAAAFASSSEPSFSGSDSAYAPPPGEFLASELSMG